MRVLCCSFASIVLLLATLPAQALYKIVGPDGRVTYTDRAPVAGEGRVSALAPSGAPVDQTALPPELRQINARWPVTLYTAPDCAPCDDARRLLRARGVPHAELAVMTDEDRAAWVGLIGGSEAPALKIGTQMLRGLDPTRWNEYLDAAGYPARSKLPPTYEFAAPLPLVPRKTEQARVAPVPRPAAPAAVEQPSPTGIRF